MSDTNKNKPKRGSSNPADEVKIQQNSTDESVEPVENKTPAQEVETPNMANYRGSKLVEQLKRSVSENVKHNSFKDAPEGSSDKLIDDLFDQLDVLNSLKEDSKMTSNGVSLMDIELPETFAWLIKPRAIRWDTSNEDCADLSLKPKAFVEYDAQVIKNAYNTLCKWYGVKRANWKPFYDMWNYVSINEVTSSFFVDAKGRMSAHSNYKDIPYVVGDVISNMFDSNYYIGDYDMYIQKFFEKSRAEMKLGLLPEVVEGQQK